jgi:hypothetical protein
VPDPKSVARFGGERMLIAPPLAYDEIMKRVPSGKIITTDRIRDYLAKEHEADFVCPLTAGIFISLAAHASAEHGGVDPTPYHRTLKKDGELNEKYPDGIDGQRALLEMEGHTVAQKGKRFFVTNYEANLFELE